MDDDTIDWVFARILLIGGLLEAAGAGDEQVSPCYRMGSVNADAPSPSAAPSPGA